MGINDPTDEFGLSPDEENLAEFSQSNEPWRAKYDALLLRLSQKEETFFGVNHPLFLEDVLAGVVVYRDGSSWFIEVCPSKGRSKLIHCEQDRLRVLHDGKHVFSTSFARQGQNTQPIHPYHGAPVGEEEIQACREIQRWLNPVIDFLNRN